MLNKAFHHDTGDNRLIRLVLMFALVFAAAHVALHDLDVSGGGLIGSDECQVCRLNHVPVASSAPPSLFHPLQLLAHVLPVEVAEYHVSRRFNSLWARAPPLF